MLNSNSVSSQGVNKIRLMNFIFGFWIIFLSKSAKFVLFLAKGSKSTALDHQRRLLFIQLGCCTTFLTVELVNYQVYDATISRTTYCANTIYVVMIVNTNKTQLKIKVKFTAAKYEVNPLYDLTPPVQHNLFAVLNSSF